MIELHEMLVQTFSIAVSSLAKMVGMAMGEMWLMEMKGGDGGRGDDGDGNGYERVVVDGGGWGWWKRG